MDELRDWTPRIQQLESQVGSTYGYFNNHFAGNAPLNALQLLSLLGTITPHQERKMLKMLEGDEIQQMFLNDFH
jgi:uncharacterized protein YecE (DUF72 family)